MQNRRKVRKKKSVALKDNLDKLNTRESSCPKHFDCSNEYEEETHISYQFRRWAHHISSVSNNVTSKLRDLIGIHSYSNTPNNHSLDANFEAENRTTSNDAGCDIRRYLQRANRHKRIPRENLHRRYGHMTVNHRQHEVIANRVEMTSNFGVAHGVSTYPPVLLLPRIDHRVNRHPIHASFYQTQRHSLRCRHMQGDECRDGWYQQYHHFGNQWGCDGYRSANHYSSTLSDRHETAEKLSSLKRDSKMKDFKRKSTRGFRKTRKIKPDDYDARSMKHFRTHTRDFHTESYGNGLESVSPVNDSRRSREESFSRSSIPRNYGNNNLRQYSDHSLKSCAHSKSKKVVWNLQLSDGVSQEHIASISSRTVLSAESSVTLFIEKRKAFVDQKAKSNPADYQNVEESVEDEAKKPEHEVPLTNNINTADFRRSISDDAQESRWIDFSERAHCVEANDDLVDVNNVRRSSATENSIDSLLQSLRQHMETLSNIHSLNTVPTSGCTEQRKNEKLNFTKEYSVASCLAGTYLPRYLDNRQNKIADHYITNNEEIRPSFSDRIQDIWRDGSARSWKTSSEHETSSRYNFKSDKNLSSKLSLSGPNQQPALEEYSEENNNTVTLARILEKLIDSKPKAEVNSITVSENSKPPARTSQDTCMQVNVGVQKSTTTSTMFSEHSGSMQRLMKKQKSRGRYKKSLKSRPTEFSIQTPRPLQILSGQSIIPISSIQFMPVIQPGSLSDCYANRSDIHGHSMIIDNPVIPDTIPVAVVETVGSKYSSFNSNCGSPSSEKTSSLGVNNGRLIAHDMKSFAEMEINGQNLTEQERASSLLLETIEHEQRPTQQAVHNTDLNLQHKFYQSASARIKRPIVAKDKADAACETMSMKSHSWWTRTFRRHKSRIFRGKIASFFNYVTKKHTGHDFGAQKHDFEKAVTEIVVPTPPIRRRRKSTSCKSVQWSLDEEVSRSIQKIDSFQVTENRRSNKSTSVFPIITRVTVSSATNTVEKETHKVSAELSPKQNNTVLITPEIMEASKHDFTDSSIKSLNTDQTLIESDIVVNLKETSESLFTETVQSSDDFPPTFVENSEMSMKSCRRENRSEECHVVRSLSSKIPLATKAVSPFNVLSTNSSKRPSTAPTLENLPIDSLQSNTLFEETKGGELGSKVRASPETVKRLQVFKQNRSSLLRASMSKKYVGKCNLSRRMTWPKVMERNLISIASTSPFRIDEEKPSLESHSAEEDLREKPSSEKHVECDQSNATTKSSLSADPEASDSLKPLSIISNAGVIAGTTPCCNLFGVSVLKSWGLTLNKETANPPIPISRSQCSDLNHFAENESRDRSKVDRSFRENLEKTNNERSSSEFISPVNEGSLDATKEKETSMVNLESQTLCDNENVVSGLILLEQETVSSKDRSIVFDGEKNAKFEIDKGGDENINSEFDYPKKWKESPNKICLGDSNLSKQQSLICNENSTAQENPDERAFACRVKIDGIQTSLNHKSKFQPQLVYSTALKTDKYLHNRDPDSISNNKAVKSVLRIAKSAKNGKSKWPKLCESRQKKTEEILEVIRRVINAAISESLNITRKRNSGARTSNENMQRRTSSNFEKLSKHSSDSLQNPVSLVPTKESSDSNSSSSLLDKKELLPNLSSENQRNILQENARLHFCPTNKRTITSNAIIEARQTHYPGISLSKSQFAMQGSKISCGHLANTTYRDNKMIGNLVTDRKWKEKIPIKIVKTDYYLTQSIITFDLAEMVDGAEKLCPSMFNARLESRTKIAESKPEDSLNKKKLQTEEFSDSDSSSRVMDDENNGRSSKGDRNVKIDNKVLEEKVKCSIENGVPLKTITITDPSVINHNGRHINNAIVNKIPCVIKTNVSDEKREVQCSHTTWTSHGNRALIKINKGNKGIPETSLEPKNSDLKQLINKDSVLNMTGSSILDKKSRRPRGTLIPRYKTIMNVVPGNNKSTNNTNLMANAPAKVRCDNGKYLERHS